MQTKAEKLKRRFYDYKYMTKPESKWVI